MQAFMSDERSLITTRRLELDVLRKQLEKKLSELEAEDAELAQAERVIERLQLLQAEPVTPSGRVRLRRRPSSEPTVPREGEPRPEGIPTTREMIVTVLTEAKAAGKRGLTGKQLAMAIGERWWPGIGFNSVLPEASRLVKKDIIRKKVRLFTLPDEDEDPDAEASGSSSDSGGGGLVPRNDLERLPRGSIPPASTSNSPVEERSLSKKLFDD